MAQIDLRLSAKVQKETQRSEVLIRFFRGSKFDVYGKSGVFITPKYFRYFVNRTATRKAGINIPDKVESVTMEEAEKCGYSIRKSGEIVISARLETEDVKYNREQKDKIDGIRKFIGSAYEALDKDARESISSEWLAEQIDRFHNPEKYLPFAEREGRKSFYSLMEEYITKKQFSAEHTKAFRVLMRSLARYELFVREMVKEKKDFSWDFNKVGREDIEDFEDYMRNEYDLAIQYPKLYEKLLSEYPVEISSKHKTQKLHKRGENTIVKLKKKLKAFFLWLYETGRTKNRPFDGITIGVEKYGVPYYLTIEERNQIADADLRMLWEQLSDEEKKKIPESSLGSLNVQRDIFIFQCLIGCRVGDLMRLTSANITDGVLEYVPNKTKDEDVPAKARIPLGKRALKLVQQYSGTDKKGRLFPFISADKFNDSIKHVLQIVGITRIVQVRNSITGETESKRICDVASSHMARRTFVGAAYKQVKDPNIVGKMSGHAEGSRAFARYRNIDDEMLKDVIKSIE